MRLIPCVSVSLLATLARGRSAQAHNNHDEDAFHTLFVGEIDALDQGRPRLDGLLSQNSNVTTLGMLRMPTRRAPRSLLQKRQNNETCPQPGSILACPSSDASPCCDQAFPICCHDPAVNCCPTGYFCSGLRTCCKAGSIGCGDACCVYGYTCGMFNGTPTCLDSSSSPAPSNTQALPTNGGGQDRYSPSKSAPNNVPIIAGAVGGAVAALILIALLAWFFLRRNPPVFHETPTIPQPTNNTSSVRAGPPSMTVVTRGNVPSTHKASSSWSTTSPSSIYAYSNVPHDMSSRTGYAPGSPPGMVSVKQGLAGPGGYVPPPPEDVVPNTTSFVGAPYHNSPSARVAHLPSNSRSSPQPEPSTYSSSRVGTASLDTIAYSNTRRNTNVGEQNNAQQYPWTAGVTPNPEQQPPVWEQYESPPSRVYSVSPPPIGPMSPPPPFAFDPPAFDSAGVASSSEPGIGQNATRSFTDEKARPKGAGAPSR